MSISLLVFGCFPIGIVYGGFIVNWTNGVGFTRCLLLMFGGSGGSGGSGMKIASTLQVDVAFLLVRWRLWIWEVMINYGMRKWTG
jgi:hypothetical protein